MLFAAAAVYSYLPSRDADNTVWYDCRYTCRTYYTGSVDVGNETCLQSLLCDRRLTRILVIGISLVVIYGGGLQSLKLRCFLAAAVYSYLPRRNANSAVA